MISDTVDEASNEVVGAPKRNRRVERTVDLSEPEIAAVAAAKITPPPAPRHVSTETGANT